MPLQFYQINVQVAELQESKAGYSITIEVDGLIDSKIASSNFYKKCDIWYHINIWKWS